MKRVLVFGSFDPLHDGHRNFFAQAKALGDQLTVVVAHGSALREGKKREPFQSEEERLTAVASDPSVNKALIGNKEANRYNLLSELEYDVIALGYDQRPSDEEVRVELDRRGKQRVEVIRLKPFKPEIFKSTLIRNQHRKDSDV